MRDKITIQDLNSLHLDILKEIPKDCTLSFVEWDKTPYTPPKTQQRRHE